MRWEEIWDAALRIRNLFLTTPLPRRLRGPSGRRPRRTARGDVPVVVRSSAPGEDAEGASFAGLHESYVNVRGLDAVLEHVRLVWASLWSDAALLYRRELGLDPRRSAMAVVVQELVDGDDPASASPSIRATRRTAWSRPSTASTRGSSTAPSSRTAGCSTERRRPPCWSTPPPNASVGPTPAADGVRVWCRCRRSCAAAAAQRRRGGRASTRMARRSESVLRRGRRTWSGRSPASGSPACSRGRSPPAPEPATIAPPYLSLRRTFDNLRDAAAAHRGRAAAADGPRGRRHGRRRRWRRSPTTSCASEIAAAPRALRALDRRLLGRPHPVRPRRPSLRPRLQRRGPSRRPLRVHRPADVAAMAQRAAQRRAGAPGRPAPRDGGSVEDALEALPGATTATGSWGAERRWRPSASSASASDRRDGAAAHAGRQRSARAASKPATCAEAWSGGYLVPQQGEAEH